jgi:hypothetical protein
MITTTNETPPVMVTPERAAMIANTSITTIWRAVRTGKLQSYKRGPKDTRFLQSDVETFKLSRSREGH